MHCVECHNTTDPAGGLDLTRAEGLRAGGDSGAAIDPENWERSLLWERIDSGEMPPESARNRPRDAELTEVADWLQTGAKWPAGRILSEFEFSTPNRAGRDWWSLRPLHPQPYPLTSPLGRNTDSIVGSSNNEMRKVFVARRPPIA